jgi:hypothetical protein
LIVGVRTKDDTAKSPADYVAINEAITLEKGPCEHIVSVKIVDDEGWEPDEDFFVELYDLDTKEKLAGDNCRTKITILDDDQPGILGFEERHIKVRRKD